MTPKQLIKNLGRDDVAAAMDVDPESIRTRVASGGLLPSGWFEACEAVAIAKGVKCPKNCFNFARKDGNKS